MPLFLPAWVFCFLADGICRCWQAIAITADAVRCQEAIQGAPGHTNKSFSNTVFIGTRRFSNSQQERVGRGEDGLRAVFAQTAPGAVMHDVFPVARCASRRPAQRPDRAIQFPPDQMFPKAHHHLGTRRCCRRNARQTPLCWG